MCGETAERHRYVKEFSGENEVCRVCFEEMTETWVAERCGKHVFCRKCAREYVTEKVNEGQEICCLYQFCEAVLTDEEVGSLVEPQVVSHWERKKTERNPQYRHCPGLNCPGFVLSTEDRIETKCPVCARQLCFHCGKDWHSPRTCETQSKAELCESRTVKACPGCQRFIEKDQGCDHMTCQVCRHQWCWQCLCTFTPTHTDPSSPDYCPYLHSLASPPPDTTLRKVMFYLFGFPLYLLIIVLLTPVCYLLWLCIVVWYVRLEIETQDDRNQWICYGILLWPFGPVFAAWAAAHYLALKWLQEDNFAWRQRLTHR